LARTFVTYKLQKLELTFGTFEAAMDLLLLPEMSWFSACGLKKITADRSGQQQKR